MDSQKLVRMVNEISAFFAAEPDRAVAIEGIAAHLRRFWEPRMRRQLLAHLDENAGAGLAPLALEAIRQRRADLEPRA